MAHQRIDARKTSACSGALSLAGSLRLASVVNVRPPSRAIAVARAQRALILAELPFEAPLRGLPEPQPLPEAKRLALARARPARIGRRHPALVEHREPVAHLRIETVPGVERVVSRAKPRRVAKPPQPLRPARRRTPRRRQRASRISRATRLRAQRSIGTVSGHGSTVCVLIRRPFQSTRIKVVEELAPRRLAFSAHIPDRKQDLLAIPAHPYSRENRDVGGLAVRTPPPAVASHRPLAPGPAPSISGSGTGPWRPR